MLFYGPYFLPLFVAGIRADNPYDAMPLYDLAFIAYLSY